MHYPLENSESLELLSKLMSELEKYDELTTKLKMSKIFEILQQAMQKLK